MATATIERNDLALTPADISARKRQAAIDEMRRNGIEPPKEKYQAPVAPLPSATPEVVSAPKAKPMAKADICNVEPLTLTEQELLIRRLELCNPKLARDLLAADEALWDGGWDKADERWTLTPHQLRKQNERRRKAVKSC